FTGAGTGIVVSCLFSPDSSIRTTAIIVGIIMIGIGWYKKSKNDKKIFQYMKEQNNFEKKSYISYYFFCNHIFSNYISY
ncbi:hypothetical protein EGR52_10350, partial [bacterium]|nr:hypothetical protein [bacterium]